MSGKGKLKSKEIVLITCCLLIAVADIAIAKKIHNGITEARNMKIEVISEESSGEDRESPDVLVASINPEKVIRDKLAAKYGVSDNDLILYQALINVCSWKHNQDPIFILSLSGAESGFNPRASSYLGERYGRGIMMVSEIGLAEYNNWHSAEEQFTPEELYNPFVNIEVGCWILEHNREYYKVPDNRIDSLSAYNVGPTAWRGGKLASERYTNWILSNCELLGSS